MKGECKLCGGKTHDVTDEYLTKDDIKKYKYAHVTPSVNECENCGYLGSQYSSFFGVNKEIDEYR